MVPPGAGTPEQRPAFLPAAQERILAQPDGKARFGHAVHELSKAFALAVPHAEAQGLRDDVAFFQAVRAALLKRSPAESRPDEELDHAIRKHGYPPDKQEKATQLVLEQTEVLAAEWAQA